MTDDFISIWLQYYYSITIVYVEDWATMTYIYDGLFIKLRPITTGH